MSANGLGRASGSGIRGSTSMRSQVGIYNAHYDEAALMKVRARRMVEIADNPKP